MGKRKPIALTLVSGILLWSVMAAPAAASPVLRDALSLAGLNPTAFAVAGLDPAETAAVLAAITSSARVTAVQSRQNEAAAAGAALALALARAGLTGSATAAEVQHAREVVTAARQALRDELEALITESTSTLAIAQRERLGHWRQNQADLPAEFRAVVWNHSDLRTIRRALQEERLASTAGPASNQSAQFLAQIRARPEVVAARIGLQTHLPDITVVIANATR